MPPTLTTKSSPDINAPRFSIVTKALSGDTTDGKRRFQATASSTITDRAGDEISLKALEQMAAKFREGVTIFTDHDNKVGNAFGTTDTAEIFQRGEDPKTGQRVWDLDISGPVNEPSPTAVQLHDSISGGYVKLGCSIDAFVLEHERKKSGGLSIEGLDVYAASIVGVPMNQRSWTQKAVRAIKSFYGDPEEPDEEDGILTKELDAVPEKDTAEGVAADPATPTTPDTSEAGKENEAAAAEEPATIEKAEACPDCGQSADTTGCPNDYHSAKSADASDSGVQESASETPETTPTDTTETETPDVEKAAGVPTEDVAELVGHVRRLVTEIGGLRAENAELREKAASLELANHSVGTEVELARQVIEKVMQTPLRAKTAGYVKTFTDAHQLFDPDIAEYLTKRGE